MQGGEGAPAEAPASWESSFCLQTATAIYDWNHWSIKLQNYRVTNITSIILKSRNPATVACKVFAINNKGLKALS